MEKAEEQIDQLLEELKNLEKEIINLEYEIQSFFYSVEIRLEYEEQKNYYNKKINKNAERLISLLKEKNPSISQSRPLAAQESELSPKEFAILLAIVEKHQLIGNENSINEIAKFISIKRGPYSSLKWELNELSTSFLKDKDIEFFLFGHTEVFGNYKEVYKSDILFQNEEFKKLLMEQIKNNRIAYSDYYCEDLVRWMEKTIVQNESCNKQFLFSILENNFKHMRENIDSSQPFTLYGSESDQEKVEFQKKKRNNE